MGDSQPEGNRGHDTLQSSLALWHRRGHGGPPGRGEHGVVAANIPDFCFEKVSDSTIAFIFGLNGRTFILDRYVRTGSWGSSRPIPYWSPSRLRGQTPGAVGLGNIGRMVARKAGCLGLTLLGHDPYVAERAGSISLARGQR